MNKKFIINYSIILLAVFLVYSSSCSKDENDNNDEVLPNPSYGTFIDPRDSYSYKTISIGNQIWLAENLKYLPSVVGPETPGTGSYTDPYYYVYGYNGTNIDEAKATSNYSVYGVLYNWPAANAACPSGWHLPSDTEWVELENFLANNGYNFDGTTGGGNEKIAKAMASVNSWISSSYIGAVGNTDFTSYRNKSGFSALPGGYRFTNATFNLLGQDGFWWSATEYSSKYSWFREMRYDAGCLIQTLNEKDFAFSVRCIKDN